MKNVFKILTLPLFICQVNAIKAQKMDYTKDFVIDSTFSSGFSPYDNDIVFYVKQAVKGIEPRFYTIAKSKKVNKYAFDVYVDSVGIFLSFIQSNGTSFPTKNTATIQKMKAENVKNLAHARNIYKILRVRIRKNDQLLQDWTPISNLSTKNIGAYNNPILAKDGDRSLLSDYLPINDFLEIELDAGDSLPKTYVKITHKTFDLKPFMTEKYIEKSTFPQDSYAAIVKAKSMYDTRNFIGWQGDGHTQVNLNGLLPKTRLALLFRNWPIKATDSTYQYRISAGGKAGQWITSTNYIILPPLASRTNYTVEMRYKQYSQLISTYTFKTLPFWYKQKTLLYDFFIGLLLFAIAIVIYTGIKLYRTKRLKIRYQLESQVLSAQLNPHFLFNSMSSIQGLINNNQTEKANEYLSGFSGLLRTTLDMSNKESITLHEDIQNMENYIHFEQLRFHFHYQKYIVPSLPLEEIMVPPLLVQPLIENAVKHGLAGMGEKGMLSLKIASIGHNLFLEIEDNGKGFDANNYQMGYGIDLVRKRMALYNKMYRKKQMELNMTSSAKGTKMSILFKNWIEND